MNEDRHINFKLLRDRILSEAPDVSAERQNKKYWRSLDELADSPIFEEFVRREFPQQAEEWNDPVERRTFLKLMGASLALAGLSGCVFQPPERIVPYVKQPEEEVPGKSLFFATAFTLGGVATPVLARSNEGRPTKIEGNPDHPNNKNGDPNDRGSSATDIFTQASVLGLYDPDRSQTATYREEARPWTTFIGDIRTALNGPDGNSGLHAKQGAGLRFLTETITSPTLAAQMKEILTAFPQAKWHQYEPVNRDNARAGAMMAFGQDVNAIYDFSKADRIHAIDCDFLSAHPGMLRYARDYAARRRITEGKKEMSRLYVIETTPTNTGANADHRWPVRPSEMEPFIRSLAAAFSVKTPATETPADSRTRVEVELVPGRPTSHYPPDLRAIAADLKAHRSTSLVIAGTEAPAAIHGLVHAINDALGNVGKTVFYTEPLSANSVDQTQSLRELVNDINGGQVELLVIVGGNPVYNAPADLGFNLDLLNKVKQFRVHHSLYKDETSELCHWHIPAAHYLESWNDTRSYDGTVTIVQPLIEPLYQGKSAHELLAVFSEDYDRKPYDIVKDFWRRGGLGSQGSSAAAQQSQPATQRQNAGSSPQAGGATAKPAATPTASPVATYATTSGDFEASWRKWLHDGFIPNTALPIKTVAIKQDSGPSQTSGTPALSGYEIVFRTDPSIYDGRFANNGWLQELPKPLTKVTWDNVALISQRTADKLGVGQRPAVKGRESYVDTIKITHQGRVIPSAPVFIMPGQPDDVIAIHLGYGRKRAGRVGNVQKAGTLEPIGFNAYDIRRSDSPWFLSGATVERTDTQHVLATTQLHFNMWEDKNFRTDDRDIIRVKTLEEFLHEDREKEREKEKEPGPEDTLYDPSIYNYKDQGPNAQNYAWGMAIDLNSCIGCNGCTIACQAENNIPIVGKEQVERSREMHWIRLDAYFKGAPEKPEGPYFQPVPCMHCENAPCEPVCPVHATVHSAEGLNDMVYNRCVGTKYCSNNCPYKVRRFNFFLYQDWDTPTYQLMRNPDVSVRSRGVMEKCTYCVQRIQSAKITAEIEGRKVRDGEIVTACQAVCPTEAIVFGDINDPNSRVSKLKAEQRNYGLLTDLNTRPRTTYLTALRNPNPEIKGN